MKLDFASVTVDLDGIAITLTAQPKPQPYPPDAPQTARGYANEASPPPMASPASAGMADQSFPPPGAPAGGPVSEETWQKHVASVRETQLKALIVLLASLFNVKMEQVQFHPNK